MRNGERRASRAPDEVAALRRRIAELEKKLEAATEAASTGREEEDLTGRIRALAKSEETLRSVLESAPSVILTADLDGTIQYINRPPPELRREDGPGRKLLDFVCAEHHELARTRIEEAIRTRAPTAYEAFGAVSGRSFSVRIAPTLRDGEVSGLVVVAHDVTEVRRLQDRVEAADRLASIGTLAASVAHEINNPLTYVMIGLSRLALALPSAESQSARDALLPLVGQIREGTERIQRIVRDLGARVQTGGEEVGPVELAPLLDASIHDARSDLCHRAAVERRYRSAPPARAHAGRLGQVFLNLLVNAAQAIEDAGQTDGRIRVTVDEAEDGRVRVEIADNGSGMPRHVAARVFEPFVTTKEPGRGTGLGLYVCHSIIASLAGEIELETTEGEGTTFRLLLPPAHPEQERAAAPEPPARPEAPRRGLHVLVVDDEPGIRTAFGEVLAEHNLWLLSSGREALETLAERHFDAVFCDLMMPEVSGMDVRDYLRRERPEQLERVVFITGRGFVTPAGRCAEELGGQLLHKPFGPDDILSWMARLCGEG